MIVSIVEKTIGLNGMIRTLTDLLVSKIVPGVTTFENPGIRKKLGCFEAILSILLNGFLFLIKLWVGLLSGSIAVCADAFHSLSDLGSSLVVFYGFQVASQPPDPEHPFGHERAEHLTAMVIGILLLVASLELFLSSLGRLVKLYFYQNPLPPVEFSWFWVVLLVFSIYLKWVLGEISTQLGKKIDSPALEADALHHFLDAISTLFSLVALFQTPLGLPWLDGLMGVAVAFFVARSGYELSTQVMDQLLGKGPSPEFIAQIKEVILSHPDSLGVHDIVVHSYGQKKMISCHVELNCTLSVDRIHFIVEEIEVSVVERLGATCNVHFDPVDLLSPERARLLPVLNTLKGELKGLDDFHDLRILGQPQKGGTIFLDVVLSYGLSKEEENGVIQRVQKEVKGMFPESKLKLEIDPIHHF